MQLHIYSLKKVLFEGEAKSLTVRSTGGELTILDNHLPLITMLQAGPLKVINDKGTAQRIDIISGFLEVKPESVVTVLADI
ncbi:MAG: F0F1 ATP synthase subunit epsilon [bacterium]|nr:F0F1 ATP synthase subunit epsilon [bacterium]